MIKYRELTAKLHKIRLKIGRVPRQELEKNKENILLKIKEKRKDIKIVRK